MLTKSPAPQTVDEYIDRFPVEIKKRLLRLRSLIKTTALNAEESISYGMPAYKLNGPLVYFAAFDKHIGFYATPTGHTAFKKELSAYKTGKGSVQFPHDKPFPFGLVKELVRFRVKENLEKKGRKK